MLSTAYYISAFIVFFFLHFIVSIVSIALFVALFAKLFGAVCMNTDSGVYVADNGEEPGDWRRLASSGS